MQYAVTLAPIKRGHAYLRRVQGGVVKTPAPSDGLLIRMGDALAFVSDADIRRALSLLKQEGREGAP